MTHDDSSLFPPFPLADYLHHRKALEAEMRRVLERGQYVLGDEVVAFEDEFASWLGARHVVGVANGTDAIELMLRAHDIGPGAKVVVPAFAPSAVAAAVQRAGAELVFADIEPDTFTLSAASLAEVLESSEGRGVKAVIAVHLFGHPVDWSGLEEVARAHGVWLFEDAAQAHGARWHGRRVGTLGRACAFSFYPTKNLAAVGDGGAIATSDDELAQRLRSLRQYGWRERQVSNERGVNSRLDELQAAVLRTKLRTLDDQMLKRRALAALYGQHLASAASAVRQGCEHAYHLYVMRTACREALLQSMREHAVPAAIHYAVPLHHQPAFACAKALPESERAAREVVTLPLHPYLSSEAVKRVTDLLRSAKHVA